MPEIDILLFSISISFDSLIFLAHTSRPNSVTRTKPKPVAWRRPPVKTALAKNKFQSQLTEAPPPQKKWISLDFYFSQSSLPPKAHFPLSILEKKKQKRA